MLSYSAPFSFLLMFCEIFTLQFRNNWICESIPAATIAAAKQEKILCKV